MAGNRGQYCRIRCMFEVGRIYRRRELHERYGGQRQGGISTPAAHPMVLVFTGESGQRYGYADGPEDDGRVFRYYGEGQQGSMEFRGGNAAVRDHAANGKDLYLFEAAHRGHVRFVGQMVCAGADLVHGVPDRSGVARAAIVFRLVRADTPTVEAPVPEAASSPGMETRRSAAWYWTAPLDEVARLARERPAKTQDPKSAERNVYERSEAVRVCVLRRANGRCEACGSTAPFVTLDGRPYLEAHHTRRLSDGGPDDPAWVIGLCPTCHRRAHYAADGTSFNETLKATANSLSGAGMK